MATFQKLSKTFNFSNEIFLIFAFPMTRVLGEGRLKSNTSPKLEHVHYCSAANFIILILLQRTFIRVDGRVGEVDLVMKLPETVQYCNVSAG